MKKLFVFLFIIVVGTCNLFAQGDPPLSERPQNICEPCTQLHPDVEGEWENGWPTTWLEKKIKYGGCTFTVYYQKRCCGGSLTSPGGCNGTQDLKIISIVPDLDCAKNPFAKGDISDCDWLKSIQDMAFSIMTEFVRSNPMSFSNSGIWRVMTPACFGVTGSGWDGLGPHPNGNYTGEMVPPPECTNACCLHKIRVTVDECGITRMREVEPFNDGGCQGWTPGIPRSPTSHISYGSDCNFDYQQGSGLNCIPICGRKLTIDNNPSGPPVSDPFAR